MNFDESKYEDFLEVKRSEMMNRFQTLLESVGNAVCRTPELDIIRSPPRNCRQKCRFAIRRKEDLGMAVGLGDELVHAMWDEGRPTVVVEAFPIASMQIYNMMPVLLSVIQSSSRFACMVNGFASVHYLSTLSGALIVTMNYDATNADSFQDEVDGNKCTWRIAAEQLREELRSLSIASITSLSLIGRARGAKVVVGEDCVIETLHLADGRSLSYKQVEEGFSNPNAVVNQGALGWLCAVAQEAVSTPSSVASSGTGSASCSGDPTTKSVATAPEVEARRVDLLEMYCGNGNHTVALAGRHALWLHFSY